MTHGTLRIRVQAFAASVRLRRWMAFAAITSAGRAAAAQAANYDSVACPSCASWNAPHAPVKLFGNSYYVGTDGLSAVLITSAQGHVLIDGGLPASAAVIAANIETAGFRLRDVKLILNSHDHYDHAGGIAELARRTGAKVVASGFSAQTLRAGRALPSDPQFGVALPYPLVQKVAEFHDGDTLRVGELALVAHLTPGHTRGGTTWTWRSCEAGRCLDMVYADSQSPISDDSFRYTGDARYPSAAADFARGQGVLEHLPCDLLITPHPGGSQLFERLAANGSGPRLIDADACKRYAASSRAALAKRLATERGTK